MRQGGWHVEALSKATRQACQTDRSFCFAELPARPAATTADAEVAEREIRHRLRADGGGSLRRGPRDSGARVAAARAGASGGGVVCLRRGFVVPARRADSGIRQRRKTSSGAGAV